MKKSLGNVVLIITAMLCLFLCGQSSINTKAATAKSGTLMSGEEFNRTLKSFAHNILPDQKSLPVDHTIERIKFLDKNEKVPEGKDVRSKKVGTDVTAYFDYFLHTMYIKSTSSVIYFPEDCSHMFYAFHELEEIDFGKARIDTSAVKDMHSMFSWCYAGSLDFSQFNTSNVVNMSNMFYGCKVKKLDLSTFDTSNVQNMNGMFQYCQHLKSINISGFDTSKVENMGYMFFDCSELTSIDVSGFDTSNVRYMFEMFARCTKLKHMDISHFKTAKVTEMEYMFEWCEGLESVELGDLDTSSLDNISWMFYMCTSLEKLDMSGLKMGKKTGCKAVLYGDNSLKVFISPRNITKDFDLPGEYYIDDNKDGFSDSYETYTKLLYSSSSHRYVFYKALKPKKDDGIEDESESSFENTHQNDYGNSEGEGEFIVTVNGVTYVIDKAGNATATLIKTSGKLSINKVKANGHTYPVVGISDNACRKNNKLKSITIGSNITKIGKNAFKGCKKLKKITIKANKSLKVGKGAFKKLPKGSHIKVKAAKGKTSKKLVRAIKKQTNATVN